MNRYRLFGWLPLAVLSLLVIGAAAIGQANSRHGGGHNASSVQGVVGTAPGCQTPTVTDIDNLGPDATWNAAVDDVTAIGHSLTVDPLDDTINSVHVVIGDASLLDDPSSLSPTNPDVLANAVASVENTVNNLINMITDLVFSPPDTGNLPVYVLIDFTAPDYCGVDENGQPEVGSTAVPVGTLVVTPS